MYPSLLERLKTQHESISELIAGLDNKQLTAIPAPGKWSVKDNIAHLASYQPVFLERINRILNEDTPSFERYSADNDPGFPGWQAKPMHELLNSIRNEREKIVKFYLRSDKDLMKRCGFHPRFGKLTLVQWLDFFILHEAHHLFTVFQLSRVKE